MAIYGHPFPNYRGGQLQRGRLILKCLNGFTVVIHNYLRTNQWDVKVIWQYLKNLNHLQDAVRNLSNNCDQDTSAFPELEVLTSDEPTSPKL